MARRSRSRYTVGAAHAQGRRLEVEAPRRVRTAFEDQVYLPSLSALDPVHTVYPWYESRALQRGVTRGFVAHPLRSVLSLSFDREPAPRAPRRRAMPLQFPIPERVLLCVRRKERRRALFAFGRAGFSGSARKRHWKRNQFSNWRC